MRTSNCNYLLRLIFGRPIIYKDLNSQAPETVQLSTTNLLPPLFQNALGLGLQKMGWKDVLGYPWRGELLDEAR